ncbi:hypothetical protein K438DRAFT_914814 [Mycena galopus ATCC 62051]|nr:hypothetical protein K438DRAFT_914814 [Mycena galopus ATCC 62051]
MSQQYRLSIKTVQLEASWKPDRFHQNIPNLYAVISLNGSEVHRTRVMKKGRTATWNEKVSFASETSSILCLQVYHKSSVLERRDPCIGVSESQISDLLETQLSTSRCWGSRTAPPQESSQSTSVSAVTNKPPRIQSRSHGTTSAIWRLGQLLFMLAAL